MKLCEFLDITRERVNIIDSRSPKENVACQIRDADLAPFYLDSWIYQAKVIDVKRSNEYGCLDVTIDPIKGDK